VTPYRLQFGDIFSCELAFYYRRTGRLLELSNSEQLLKPKAEIDCAEQQDEPGQRHECQYVAHATPRGGIQVADYRPDFCVGKFCLIRCLCGSDLQFLTPVLSVVFSSQFICTICNSGCVIARPRSATAESPEPLGNRRLGSASIPILGLARRETGYDAASASSPSSFSVVSPTISKAVCLRATSI